MGQKDIVEKHLESYNDVFSDIINTLVFHGEQRILPCSLEDTSVHSIYKADDGRLHEQERDVVKIWKDCNVEIALYGIENQTKVERLMPLRIFGYEGASYRSQLLQKSKKVIPVITIVLYFGKEHWNQPKTLKELLKIPDGLDMYVNDCKIHVFEVSWLTEEQINMFQSDFKIVANFFVNKRKHRNYIPDDPTEMKHVDEVLNLLSVMTGDRRYEEVLSDKKGVVNMCEVAERLVNEGLEKGLEKGRAEGLAEGLEKGRAEGLEKGLAEGLEKGLEKVQTDVITRLIKKGKTPEEIHELLDFPLEDIFRIEQTLSEK